MFGLGLNLGLGRPLKVPPAGGYQILTSSIISTTIDTPQTITLSATNTTSYAVTGLPTWCALNSLTGEIVCTPDGTAFGHNKFDVVLTNAVGSITITNGLRISLYKPQADIAVNLADAVEILSTDIAGVSRNATFTKPWYVVNPDGLTWTALLPLWKEYGISNQVIGVDLNTGLSPSNVEGGGFTGHLTHVGTQVQLTNNRVLVPCLNGTGSTTATATCHVYDANAHAWTFNATNVDAQVRGETFPACCSTDQSIFLAGVNYTNDTLIIQEISMTTLQVINTWTNVVGSAQPVGESVYTRYMAVDDTHIYIDMGKQPYELLSIPRAGGGTATPVCTVLATGAIGNYNPMQREFGCWVVVDAQYYYLQNGTMILAGASNADLDNPTNIPWVNKEPLYKWGIAVPTPSNTSLVEVAYPFDDDMNGLVPTSGTTGKLFISDDRINYTEYAVPNVTSHDIELRGIGKIDGTKIMFLPTGYNGYSILDTFDNSIIYKRLVSENVSNGTFAYDATKNRTSFAGYPNATAYIWNNALPWDNNIEATYTPAFTNYSNPEFLGNLHAFSDAHAIYGSAIGKVSGRTYHAGKLMRDGNGGGIGVYDYDNDIETGYRYEVDGVTPLTYFNDYHFKWLYAVGDYIIGLANDRAYTLDMRIFVINDRTDTISSFAPVLGTTEAGRVTSIAGDDEHIYHITTNTAGTVTTFSKIAIPLGTVVMQKTLNVSSPLKSSLDANEDSDLVYSSDGFFYTVLGTNTLTRIDPTTGLFEPVRTIGHTNIGRFIEYNNKMYCTGSEVIKIMDNYDIPLGYNVLVQNVIPTTIPQWILKSLVQDGTQTVIDATDENYTIDYTFDNLGSTSTLYPWVNNRMDVEGVIPALVAGVDTVTMKMTVQCITGSVRFTRMKLLGTSIYKDFFVDAGQTLVFTESVLYGASQTDFWLTSDASQWTGTGHNFKITYQLTYSKP